MLFCISFIIEKMTPKLTRELKKKVRIGIIICFVLLLTLPILLAYGLKWESSILHIRNPAITDPLIEQDQSKVVPSQAQNETEPANEDSSKEQPSLPQVPQEDTKALPEIGTIFEDVYETHIPDKSVSTAVTFRQWNTTSDKDLRGDTHSGQIGYYIHYSNLFNSLGASSFDDDKIVSELHFRLKENVNLVPSAQIFSGMIVSGNDSQGSEAFAEITIKLDGAEVWKTEEYITGNTIKPSEFSIDIRNIKSEVTICISCMPSGNGLSLGIIDLRLSEVSDGDIMEALLPEDYTTKNGRDLFTNAFASGTADNHGINSAILSNWDSFTNADLRGESYANSGTGFLLKTSNIFSTLGASSASPVITEIHLAISPTCELQGLKWSGLFVAEKSTVGSNAYADIAILIDDMEVWRTQEPITGNTVKPTEFLVDMSSAKYEAVIRVSCTPLDAGLALGVVKMDVKHE